MQSVQKLLAVFSCSSMGFVRELLACSIWYAFSMLQCDPQGAGLLLLERNAAPGEAPYMCVQANLSRMILGFGYILIG